MAREAAHRAMMRRLRAESTASSRISAPASTAHLLHVSSITPLRVVWVIAVSCLATFSSALPSLKSRGLVITPSSVVCWWLGTIFWGEVCCLRVRLCGSMAWKVAVCPNGLKQVVYKCRGICLYISIGLQSLRLIETTYALSRSPPNYPSSAV